MERERRDLRKYFYRELAPWGRLGKKLRFSGAVSYGYVAMAAMSILVLMCFSYFFPWSCGYAAALYIFIAYPYFFGFKASITGDGGAEIVWLDDTTWWPPAMMALLILAGTIAVQVHPAVRL